MSEKQYRVERGGSGHEWYVVAFNDKRISCSEYEHEARHIADKLNAYPKLVEALKQLVERVNKDGGMVRSSLIKAGQGGVINIVSPEAEALLTELKELE